MFGDADFLHNTYVTFAYAIASTGIELGLGLAVAMLLNRSNWLARILQPTLVFPMMIAPVIGTLIWKMMMQPSVGILKPMFAAVGLPSLQWAAVPETALMSVVLVDVWMFTPFAALILLAGLRSLPQGPFEAARVDGASFWFTFRNLTLPMLGNSLMTYQLEAYRTSIQFQRLGRGLPYTILLYIIIYIISYYLIKFWSRAQRRAAGYS